MISKVLMSSWPLLFLVAVALAVVGPLLMPGYILTLDMVWTPDLTPVWQADAFNNSYPIDVLLAFLGLGLPAWVVQKIFLLVLMTALLLVPFYSVILVTSVQARLFAAGLFALNPFVYTRLLAGQWSLLLGYALIPLVVHLVVRWYQDRTMRRGVQLALILAVQAMASIHFFYLCLVGLGLTGLVIWVREARTKTRAAWQKEGKTVVAFLAVLFLTTAYWTLPALARDIPLESRFDVAHFVGFAASPHGELSVYSNVALLGGFWAEKSVWQYYFLWPQESRIFLTAAVGVFVLMLCGLVVLIRQRCGGSWAFLLILLGTAAYVTALGLSNTPFYNLNAFFYEQMPGWSGLRDSQKIVGGLAFVYVVLAGVGFQFVWESARNIRWLSLLIPVICILPAVIGLYMWNGLAQQLTPVWYPVAWEEVRTILAEGPTEEKVLVLPWRGYYSLPFANERIVANVTPRYFGPNRVYASRSVEVGEVEDQEVSGQYRAIESFLRHSEMTSPAVVSAWLRTQQIRYLLLISHEETATAGGWWWPEYFPGDDEKARINSLLKPQNEKIIDGPVKLYRYDY